MLGCIVLGEDTAIPIDINKRLTIGHLKKAIKKEAGLSDSITAYKLILWKVKIPESRKREIYAGIDIKQKFGGEKLDSNLSSIETYFEKDFPGHSDGTIHIIAQLPATTAPLVDSDEIKTKVIEAFPHIDILTIDQLVVDALASIWHAGTMQSDSSSSQNDPCVKLKTEPSFFKTNLPRGIIDLTTVDLCLPSYKNYHNPFYDDPQFKETVSLVSKKIEEKPNDIIVLAGVSGGGKTSTTFGIAMQRWSIYIDFSPIRGQYGNHLTVELEKIRSIQPELEHNDQQSRVFHMLDIAILSRGLLLIKMLIEGKISSSKDWLFVQLQMDDSEIRRILGLKDYDTLTVIALINRINTFLQSKNLTLLFDEAQVLCRSEYGEYQGSSVYGKKWNLLQGYIAHLTQLPVTCLLAGTYMHMASGIFLVTSVGKDPNLHVHIVLKLPFLSRDDVLRNLDAVIDLTDVTPKTRDYLGCILRGRPRNCASFVQKLISERKSKYETKDQEIQNLLHLWFENMGSDMAVYLENACKFSSVNSFNSETAIIDVLRFRVFYNQKFKQVIKLLQHSIIPCQSPKCIILSNNNTFSDEIKINPSLESYLVSGIELFLLKRGKTLVDVFVDNIIRFNNTSSIGNELDAVFITAIIQKRGYNVREELNKWKNGQQFDLPSWITPTMRFITSSNLSGGVPIVKYVDNMTYYYPYAIQPDRFSGSDVVVSLADDKQNIILLSASCTVSGEPIKRSKVKEQLFKLCMKFQYMELPKKRKRSQDQEKEFSWKESECLQIGLGEFLPANEEDISERKVEEYDQDLDFENVDYDLNYTENTKNYLISRVSERAKNHEQIKISTENRKHIYVSVELPHRASKRSELFRLNEYGDLVIIVDDRNMEYVFGSVIKRLVEKVLDKDAKTKKIQWI